MIPVRKLRILVTVVIVVIALIFGVGQAHRIYEKNGLMVKQMLNNIVSEEYNQQERIREMEKYTKLRLIDPNIKIQLFISLSMTYSLNQDYSNMIQTAVKSIYLADRHKEYYFSAWNYLNLADTFMMLYDNDTAESMINLALEYDIPDKKKAQWIKETAYCSMAELKSKDNQTEEARKYLELSMKYVVEDAYDYEEMLLKRDIILARTYWSEGRYKEAEALIKDVSAAEAQDYILFANVNLPLREMQAKLEAVAGNLKEGEKLCDGVLSIHEEKGYKSEKLSFLRDILPLFTSDKEAFDKYTIKTLEVYSEVMDQSNDLATEYIFTIYGERYKNYQDTTLKIIYMLASCLIVVIILSLTVLLWVSKNKNITDSLTGAYNRRHFEYVYKKYLKKNWKFALIMIDIDFFKNVNDTFGHEVGDAVLKRFGKEFEQNRPSAAKLFRIGGEEFCILYCCESIKEGARLGEKLRKEAEMMNWSNDMTVTISIGLAFSGQSEDLYNLADKNLYESKKRGRNQLTYIAEEFDEK